MAIDTLSRDARAPRLPGDATSFDELAHYNLNEGPVDEFSDLPEIAPKIRNIGWTLGNDCPYRCTHCYSMNARVKGSDMSVEMIDRIVDQLAINGVETVNLGGNEPLFTNGPNPKNTLLPYIITKLASRGIEVGLTTSGITLLHLYRDHRHAFDLLNDVDVSFDSPFEQEHNKNRGAKIFHQAVQSMEICRSHNKPHTAIMCAMNWNFSAEHIEALVKLAASLGGNVRINSIKPTKPEHMNVALTPKQFYDGFSLLLSLCDPVDLGEPPIASVTEYSGAARCPCGRTSFRIHSITPDGAIHVSPCVYLHDFKAPMDLLKHDLLDIINSPQFKTFRQRNANPHMVSGCDGCKRLNSCGGGCVARSYLYNLHQNGERSMLARDPYCPEEHYEGQIFPQSPQLIADEKLVHMDYLCTWIGRPKPAQTA
ncbi:radical SAM protein with 4Fe4S-binding SPASM domain [Agrobacterium tumefaciens]|uniref:Radical SAM protein with 4Fe4S-binding SPASM domain n=1 Tax=Agrobacterium radiobacter TaxID=362 RepID=A0ABR6JCF2_AGRRD|nr:radical SAM protein [Agrobacterium radiobacter]MBB4320473.1 radical SAM protein with 4Fe4S-binding SPASM domain [Agrobacterium radiobacter]MBB4337138.1 radical SAM protein with 4Fe4S-binding SPASM domain [Agrobacterium radiobacter]MBB4492614.1 radical SAM protein with 4Fe4S-binding SPASM domain [Agrobacterium radiobacter]MBB4497512.1 radical SAM protein with 4Fe4S-binding SPASM domain [Agrobacterium radiobacter]MBB4502577.1 radical SAM protein with 4Fe4S-binding SPASM domain [Agrobacterium 